MSTKLRSTGERIAYRDRHDNNRRRNFLSYERLLQLDNALAHDEYMRKNELETRIRTLKAMRGRR